MSNSFGDIHTHYLYISYYEYSNHVIGKLADTQFGCITVEFLRCSLWPASPSAVQAYRTCPLWELPPSHPILV